jgi:tetratricopeptide (TPR) repeat protein
MDSTRFDNANKLWAAGRNEEAAREFQAMAEEADNPDEKAATLANEHRCYLQIGQLDKANEVMRQIRSLPVQDNFVRLIIDVGDAFMTTQMGKLKEGVRKFEIILESNQEELRNPENRHLYEAVQESRGITLTNLGRYTEALPILKEAVSFTNDKFDPELVHFYLGVCYQGISDTASAKEALLRAISLDLSNDFEADARYRLGVLYFVSGAPAQAKHHLEAALQMPEAAINAQLRRNIYQQMSRTCHYLEETEEEQKYKKLAQSS